MKMNHAQFETLRVAGLRPTHHNLNGFAEACYNTNSVSELEEARAGNADRTDCAAWNITPEQWRAEILLALETAMADFVD